MAGTATSQNATNELRAAGVDMAANTTKLTGDLGRLVPGSLILVDEGSMVSITHLAVLVDHAARHGSKLILAGDQQQLAAVMEVAGPPGMWVSDFGNRVGADLTELGPRAGPAGP